jgi:hypothetical protein
MALLRQNFFPISALSPLVYSIIPYSVSNLLYGYNIVMHLPFTSLLHWNSVVQQKMEGKSQKSSA